MKRKEALAMRYDAMDENEQTKRERERYVRDTSGQEKEIEQGMTMRRKSKAREGKCSVMLNVRQPPLISVGVKASVSGSTNEKATEAPSSPTQQAPHPPHHHPTRFPHR
jgi:hypothetical protein